MKNCIIITCIFFLTSGPLTAQYEIQPSFEDTLKVYESLFDLDEPLNLTLQFDVKTFQRTRQKEKYQPAKMTCIVNDTFQVTHPVRVKARGIYRRDNCTTPPFWLNIRYSGIETEELKDVRRMKMVTRCRGAQQYSDYVLREYLVYRIYNLISPYSFRTRLVRLRYIDTGRKNKMTESWAFLIEPNEILAARFNARIVKSDKLSIRTVNRDIMDQMAMFQYMIGNGDYSVTGQHNLKILAMNRPGGPVGFVPVPYDFDYTGLVNAHYAIPGENLGINSVRERYFLGPCRSKLVHLEAISDLESFRKEIIELINEFELLDEEAKLDMTDYIEGFFSQASRERFIEREIATTCR
ncbi:MAG: hypothetical protein KAR19_01865 [Bacteroidales bacterium]|nr:hypothetical protein [Bacteroidales bacterium]